METICNKCGAEFESVHHSGQNFDRALRLVLDGGYDMFTDPFDEEDISVMICHSCAVEFIRSLKFFDQTKMQGSHSVSVRSNDYPLCCEYSWTIINENSSSEEKKKVLDNNMGIQSLNNEMVYYGNPAYFRNRKEEK